ncbi:HEAT repeat domain-containing protein, partial [Singulisphaera rosea]
QPTLAAAARPIFVQAMGDPNQVVRLQAFDQAQAVGKSTTSLASEALASGYTDLGIKGLELLTAGGSEAEGRAVLEQAMLSRKDGLALEAFKLLTSRKGAVGSATRALEAANERLRTQAVFWLAGEDAKDPSVRGVLRQALESRYRLVREAAAFQLAEKKDPAAAKALKSILLDAGLPFPQQRVAQAFLAMGDWNANDVLLDRIENDPAGTANAEELLRVVGQFRRPEIVDRLLKLWDKQPKRRDLIFKTLLTISGYDQPIEDMEGDRPDDRWEESQSPRDDEVLALLMERVSAPADSKSLGLLLSGARWAKSPKVGSVLGGLTNHPDENLRRLITEAVGWRLRKRDGDAEPLRKALSHRDTLTQFLAAEGLAKSGRKDGLNVLL